MQERGELTPNEWADLTGISEEDAVKQTLARLAAMGVNGENEGPLVEMIGRVYLRVCYESYCHKNGIQPEPGEILLPEGMADDLHKEGYR